jgi:hypothetical protein
MAEQTITAGELYEQVKSWYRGSPDRRSIDERIADLPPGGIYCLRPGTRPTHDDLDAIVIFAEYLRRASQMRRVSDGDQPFPE